MTCIKLSFDLKVEIGAREELKEARLNAFFDQNNTGGSEPLRFQPGDETRHRKF